MDRLNNGSHLDVIRHVIEVRFQPVKVRPAARAPRYMDLIERKGASARNHDAS